ncbi:MAG: HEAT repeat domain-containing protein [Pseudomonadota bacterium]
MELNIAKESRIGSESLIDSLMRGERTLDPATAFRILKRRKIADKHLVFRRLLESPLSERQVKLEAALALGRSQHRDRVEILTGQLAEGDDLARFGALRALSQQDDPEAFEAVSAYRAEARDGFVKREARYAEAVLAYRLNLDGGTLKVPSKTKILDVGPEATTITLRDSKLGADKIKEIRKGFEGQALGIDSGKAPVFAARCGKKDVFILLSDRFAKERSLDWLRGGKSIPAVIGYRDYCPEGYGAAFHLFCHPAKKAGAIVLHALNMRGRIVAVGEGEAKGDQARFSLKSLDVPGQFAFEMAGAFDGARQALSFAEARSSTRLDRAESRKTPRRER